jgi:hypothetical protein
MCFISQYPFRSRQGSKTAITKTIGSFIKPGKLSQLTHLRKYADAITYAFQYRT